MPKLLTGLLLPLLYSIYVHFKWCGKIAPRCKYGMSSKMLQSSLGKTHIGGYGKTNIEFYSDMHPLQKTIITIHYHFTRMYIYMQEHVNTDIYVSLKYFICKVCIKLKKVPLQIIHPLSTKYFLCPLKRSSFFLQTWYVIDCRTFLNVLREIHDYKGMWHVGIYVCE